MSGSRRASGRGTAGVTGEDLRTWLAALLRAELGIGDVPLADGTALGDDLLLDSLATVELVMVVEDALDIGLADTAVADLRTFGDLHAAVTLRLGARRSPTLAGP
jgi:acyl carrier protein